MARSLSPGSINIGIGIGIGCGLIMAAGGLIVRTATPSTPLAQTPGFQSLEQVIESWTNQYQPTAAGDQAVAQLPELPTDSAPSNPDGPVEREPKMIAENLIQQPLEAANYEAGIDSTRNSGREPDSNPSRQIASVEPKNSSLTTEIPSAHPANENDFQPDGFLIAAEPAVRSTVPETSVFIVPAEPPPTVMERPEIGPEPRPVLSESAAIRSVQFIEQGKSLAQKGATADAEQHFIDALRVLAADHDLYTHSTSYSRALDQGLLALQEIRDFTVQRYSGGEELEPASICQRHQSNAVASSNLPVLGTAQALELYASYAQQQLELGAGHNGVTAEAMYCLGKLMTIQSLTNISDGYLLTRKALVFHQAALACDPRNDRSAHELGVLLADLGDLQQARMLLKQSLQIQPTARGWENLAKLHQRMQEPQLAEVALAEAQRLATAENLVAGKVESNFEGRVQQIPTVVPSKPAQISKFGFPRHRAESGILQTAGSSPLNPASSRGSNSRNETDSERDKSWTILLKSP
jgi:tetratricopeptide (TPR) repeat protein